MTFVSVRDAKNRLTERARRVERDETIVVTRNGRPVFDLVPHQARKGQRLGAIDAIKQWIDVTSIAEDLDDPLPGDFLLSRLPPDL